MVKKFFKGLDISYDDAIKTQWYSIWSTGVPKKGNLHNWFLYHAEKDADILSLSYVLHEYIEWKELEKMDSSPFDINSSAIRKMAEKDGFNNVIEYIDYLNDLHFIVLNQKIAQSASNDDYLKAHEIALIKQMKFLKNAAYEKGYLVTLGALAVTIPYANDRGTLISSEDISEEQKNELLVNPNEDELRVAKQFWNRVNDDLPYNISNKMFVKKFSHIVNPVIKNIRDLLMK